MVYLHTVPVVLSQAYYAGLRMLSLSPWSDRLLSAAHINAQPMCSTEDAGYGTSDLLISYRRVSSVCCS